MTAIHGVRRRVEFWRRVRPPANPLREVPKERRKAIARTVRQGRAATDPRDAADAIRFAQWLQGPKRRHHLVAVLIADLFAVVDLVSVGFSGASLAALIPALLWAAYLVGPHVLQYRFRRRAHAAEQANRHLLEQRGLPEPVPLRSRIRPRPVSRRACFHPLAVSTGALVALYGLVAVGAFAPEPSAGPGQAVVLVVAVLAVAIAALGLRYAWRAFAAARGYLTGRTASTAAGLMHVILLCIWCVVGFDALSSI